MKLLLVIQVFALFLSGCTPGAATTGVTTPVEESDVSNNIIQVSTAPPKNPIPTPTNIPTDTPAPTITPTATPPGVTGDPFSNYAIQQTFRNSYVEAVGFDPESSANLVIDTLALSPDGRYLALGLCKNPTNTGCTSAEYGSKAYLVILNTASAKVEAKIPVKDVTIASLTFTPDSARLVYALRPLEVGVWNVTGAAIEKVLLKDKGSRSYASMSFSPDGSLLAITHDKKLAVYDFASGEKLKEIPNVISLPEFNSDGSLLFALASNSPTVASIFDTGSWEVIQSIQMPEMRMVDYAPDGQRIIGISSIENPSIALWDVNSATEIGRVADQTKYLWSAQFTPDGKYIFSAGMEDDQDLGGLSVWDVETQEKAASLLSMESFSRIRFTPDGKYFITTDFVEVWLWAELTAETIAARKFTMAFYDALAGGEYEKAAGMYQVYGDETATWGVSAGNSGGMAGMMREACENEVLICLPVKDVLPGGGMTRWGNQSVYVTFAGKDGGLHADSYGYNQFELFLDKDDAGNPVMEQIPLNVYP